jgi:hypothetical protein
MFLYYYPGNGPIPHEFRYAFEEGAPHHRRTVMHGPLGRGSGTIIAHETLDPALCKLDEAFQTWKSLPGDSQLCIGLPESIKPDPAPLARPNMLRGHWVKLADGSNWLVPIARGFDSESGGFYCPLPRQLEYECSTGRWMAGKVERRYEAFFELAKSHAELRHEAITEGKSFVSDPNLDNLIIAALQTNYRINHIELSFFPGAYTPETRQSVLDAIMDIPSLLEWQDKKKESGPDGLTT